MMLLKLCALAVLGVVLAMLLKQWHAALLHPFRVGMTALLATLILGSAAPIFQYLRSVSELGAFSEYAELLFKALGVALLTQTAADLCREGGESGIASQVELMGKVELLLLSIPLLHKLLSTVGELLALGGGG